MDIRLKQSTVSPQNGVDFLALMKRLLRSLFQSTDYMSAFMVKARCREEAIYCIINELWELNDDRQFLLSDAEKTGKGCGIYLYLIIFLFHGFMQMKSLRLMVIRIFLYLQMIYWYFPMT